MEVRASYLLVGTVVLALIAGLAAFSVWLLQADLDREVDRYRIAFAGDVTGLQEGSQVRYRGVPVGRVTDIRIDPDNVEKVLVTIDVTAGTPIVQDTVATLELQGITGIAFVQLRGGTQGSPRLEAANDAAPPLIASRPSTLERLFDVTPELLGRALRLVEQATLLLDEQNRQALTKSLQNIATLTSRLARPDGVAGVLGEARGAVRSVDTTSDELGALAGDLRQLTAKVDGQVDGMGDDLRATLVEMRQAAGTVGQAASALDDVAGELRQPLGDFAATGLYDLTQLVGETRELVAALNRMVKEFERDPAGFFLGNSRRGFEAE